MNTVIFSTLNHQYAFGIFYRMISHIDRDISISELVHSTNLIVSFFVNDLCLRLMIVRLCHYKNLVQIDLKHFPRGETRVIFPVEALQNRTHIPFEVFYNFPLLLVLTSSLSKISDHNYDNDAFDLWWKRLEYRKIIFQNIYHYTIKQRMSLLRILHLTYQIDTQYSL